jgi:hypothetical protein
VTTLGLPPDDEPRRRHPRPLVKAQIKNGRTVAAGGEEKCGGQRTGRFEKWTYERFVGMRLNPLHSVEEPADFDTNHGVNSWVERNVPAPDLRRDRELLQLVRFAFQRGFQQKRK